MFGLFKKKDKDLLVIEALIKNGSDVTKEHQIDFFFDFAKFEQAAPVAQALDAEGYEVKMYENGDKSFSIEAKSNMVPSITTMRNLTAKFESLAVKHGGVYDGWGAEVV